MKIFIHFFANINLSKHKFAMLIKLLNLANLIKQEFFHSFKLVRIFFSIKKFASKILPK